MKEGDMVVDQAILGAFLVDSYSLGSHWIYDEEQLAQLDMDWDTMNPPAAMWHKGKTAGDFTHYGDHTLWLLEFVTQNKSFDVQAYAKFWQEKMENYEGYIDGSSRDTLEHLKAGNSALDGVVNHDLSICGRIAPLLLVSDTLDSFKDNALNFAKLTHNDPIVLEGVDFFATLLYQVVQGDAIIETMQKIKANYSEQLQKWVTEGLESRDKDTFTTIRTFGPACGIDGGCAGAIHLLSKYSTLETMMKENAKAGGDSSARGMVAGMIIAARENKSYALTSKMNAYEHIKRLL
jgi:ADP-ribosylglycohydrolase